MDRKQKAQRKHEGRVKKKQGEKIGKFLKRGGYIKDGLAAPSPTPTRGGHLNSLTINALESGMTSTTTATSTSTAPQSLHVGTGSRYQPGDFTPPITTYNKRHIKP